MFSHAGRWTKSAAVRQIEAILDPHVLLIADINPESRVKVDQGAAKPELVEAGARIFLVKVINKAGVTARQPGDNPESHGLSGLVTFDVDFKFPSTTTQMR